MANLSIGIVGLPNVGKSTLFNALLKKQVADAANYPFCTIEPNVGVVEVPDARLSKLAEVVESDKIIPAAVEFYDIAGLVRGASKGEGLGNKFLSHIRECAAIVEVVRMFNDSEIIHVADKIDPIADIQTIETELILADLETLEKQKEPKGNAPKEAIQRYDLVQKIRQQLDKGLWANKYDFTDEEKELIKSLNLLTMKPVIYVFNVSESQLEHKDQTETEIKSILQKCHGESVEADNAIYLCAKLETEVLGFSEDEQKEYLNQYGLKETGLNRLIQKSYDVLGLMSFLTAGKKEVRAWTIQKGTMAPQAAGVIHTDFEKHFIKAEIVPYDTFVSCQGWAGAREKGSVTLAGKDYVMREGDVVDFKVNA